MSITEQLQKKAKTTNEIIAYVDTLKEWMKTWMKTSDEEFGIRLAELGEQKWIKFDDVAQLFEKIDGILNQEYPLNWSPCATAMTRISRLRELLKK